jgi:hypothetical protein
MLSQLPHSRIQFVNPDGTPTRDFYNFLRDLVQIQIPIGGVIASLSPSPPKGYLAMGSTFSQTLYPQLYAVLGTDTLPSVDDGLYLASVEGGLVGTIFGGNTIGLLHNHGTKVVASGTGATVADTGTGNLVESDNRPRTLGVKFYVRAE